MAIELTEVQQRALASSSESPPRVVDPTTRTSYVLLREDVYAGLRGGGDDEFVDASYLVNEMMADDDAGDPLLESYQHYRRVPS